LVAVVEVLCETEGATLADGAALTDGATLTDGAVAGVALVVVAGGVVIVAGAAGVVDVFGAAGVVAVFGAGLVVAFSSPGVETAFVFSDTGLALGEGFGLSPAAFEFFRYRGSRGVVASGVAFGAVVVVAD